MMIIKAVLKTITVIFLTLLFLSVSLEGAYALNNPYRIDRNNDAHPWGGDDSNNGGYVSEAEDPGAPQNKYNYVYGTQASLLTGFFTAVWDQFESLYFKFSIATAFESDSRTNAGLDIWFSRWTFSRPFRSWRKATQPQPEWP